MAGKAREAETDGTTGLPPDSAATILDRVNDGFFAVDRDWRITALNPAARRAFEVAGAAGEMVGRNLWEALPALAGTPTEAAYREAMTSGGPVHRQAFAHARGVWYDVDAYPSSEGLSIYFRDVTQRRRAEEALRENESLFRQLAETIREVLWVVAPDLGRVYYVNPAYEEIFGRARNDLYEHPELLLDAVAPEDRARVRADFARAAEGDFQTEYRLIRPDGEQRWIWARGVPVRSENGAVVRIVGISEDITGRKESEEQRAFLAEAGRVLSSSLDYEETLRTVARLAVPRIADWTAIYVYAAGELRTIEVAHVDPEKVALVRAMAQRYPEDPVAETGVYHVLRTGQPEFYGEIPPELLDRAARDEEHRRVIRALGLRSGMTVPMIARGRTVGAITFVAAESGRRYTLHDLRFAEQLGSRAALAVDNARLFAEAHRRMVEERALRVAAEAVSASFTVEEVIEQIARSALEATSADGALVEQVDAERGEVRVVASYESGTFLRGATVSLAGSIAEHVIETREPLFIDRIDRAERRLPHELLASRGDSSALVLPLANGEAIGALFLLRRSDRGPFRQDEAERAAIFGKLATLAFRKVHLLHESEQRREQLEQVMESRARLVRGFTHDLRNPLGAADGFLDLVASGVYGQLSEQQQAAITRARGLVRTALGLIGDVLELARVEAGQLEIEPSPVDMRDVTRQIAEEFRPQAEAKGLALSAAIPDQLPLVQSDASRIRQILGNLMSNAVKFTPAGLITISVGVRENGPEPAGGTECIAVAVSDTGPGVPADKQALLFHEFSRLGGGDQAGAGLGLAISRNLAEALGGTLTLDSEEGQGATFTLWIPAAPAPQPTAEPE